MAAKIDQKAYLQKYLSGSSKTEKKKKKKHSKAKGTGIKIIDDDVDISKLRSLDEDELDLLGYSEDAPQIAGIIDERPDEVKRLEQFSKEKWKVIAEDDGFTSTLSVQQTNRKIPNIANKNSDGSDSDLNPSRDTRDVDSDLSPPRNSKKDNSDSNNFRKQHDSDSSPQRLRKKHHSDSDLSPSRNNSKRSTVSDSRASRKTKDDDSDLSPPRKTKHYDSDLSPPRNKRDIPNSKLENDDSDLSPPRERGDISNSRNKYSKKNDSDMSPTRQRGGVSNSRNKYGKNYDSDLSPRNKKDVHNSRMRDNNSDLSPPREKDDVSNSRNRHGKTYDSDLSFHKNKHKVSSSRLHKSKNYDSDLNPPRDIDASNSRKNDAFDSQKSKSSDTIWRIKSAKKYDSDLIPPGDSKRIDLNSREHDSDSYKVQKKKSRWSDPDEELGEKILKNLGKSERKSKDDRSSRRSSDRNDRYGSKKFIDERSSTNRQRADRSLGRNDEEGRLPKRMERTLDGKKAGLQNAKQMMEENLEFKRREAEVFDNLSEEVSGKNAQTVKRNLGKKETEEDKQKRIEKEAKDKELAAKYHQWGKGLKQVEDHEANVRDYMHEAAKPLARHRDDRDLEDALRQKERDGDPMLEYMRKKEMEKGTREGAPARPAYKGPFPPNRYNIPPGHRWDGVDRSNGHEKAVFQARSAQQAQDSERYKWSTEDM